MRLNCCYYVTLHTFGSQSVFEESLQNGETITRTPFTEPRFLVGCWFVTIFPLMTLKTNNNCLEKSQKLYI